MKKIFAILISAIIIFSFASCSDNKTSNEEAVSNSQTYESQANISSTENIDNDGLTEHNITSETDTEAVSNNNPEITDPSKWTDEEIIEYYKSCAEKSNKKAKSKQVMVLDELIINDGDGVLGFFIKILEPAIASVIEKNAFEFDGITGGFANLSVSDTKSLKAYKNGNYTVIEMTMKEQTDGIYADAFDGSVGHAITVLGDVSKAVAEFPQFEVDFENADIKVNYVNATVKVKINKDGIIEKGTWKYTCDPEIRHLDISGIMINKADAKIDYIITVGGGF